LDLVELAGVAQAAEDDRGHARVHPRDARSSPPAGPGSPQWKTTCSSFVSSPASNGQRPPPPPWCRGTSHQHRAAMPQPESGRGDTTARRRKSALPLMRNPPGLRRRTLPQPATG